MIHQLDVFGKDKVQTAIEHLQNFSEIFSKAKEEGYFVAFSGGKDSVVVKRLCDMAKVKYDAHYSVTSVDPPELVRFIKREYPDVIMDKQYWNKDGKFCKKGQQINMWNLIAEKGIPPTRLARYCCSYLKESQGKGRIVVTGVRWAESRNRATNQGLTTIIGKTKSVVKKAEEVDANFLKTAKGGMVLNNDNAETRSVVEYCYKQTKTVLNPIIDWDDSEVWEFIHEYDVPYCELYDKGYTRLGCIGCPMSTTAAAELEKYPGYKKLYIRAFDKMISEFNEDATWKTGQDVYNWWLKIEERK